ncbi:MAG TPA: hypothetical protein VKV27_14840 [Solirubrobacteraceae bacterium]|nr:hypothetical protein [Solirubrobacteraceae bacterium]
MLVAFFGAGLTMLLAGLAALIAFVACGLWWLRWLALHLALLGGVSQLVLGVKAGRKVDHLRRLKSGPRAGWN